MITPADHLTLTIGLVTAAAAIVLVGVIAHRVRLWRAWRRVGKPGLRRAMEIRDRYRGQG